MPKSFRFSLLPAIAASFLGAMGVMVGATRAAEEAAASVSYQRDVLPILRANCFGCHQEPRSRATT